MASVSLPLAAPRWLTLARVALAAVTLGGAAAAAPASLLGLFVVAAVFVPRSLGGWELPGFLVAISVAPTAMLSIVHARHLLGTPEHGLLGRSVGWGALLGAVNPVCVTALWLTAALVMGERPSEVLMLASMCFWGCTVGVPLGAALGAVFGLVYSFPLRLAAVAREYPAHDDAERALVFSGAWLALIGGLAAALPLGAWSSGIGATLALVGLVAAAVGSVLRLRRRRWLSAVLDGQVADFAVVRGQSEPAGLVPFYRRRGYAYSALLVATPHGAPDVSNVALLSEEDVRDLQADTGLASRSLP